MSQQLYVKNDDGTFVPAAGVQGDDDWTMDDVELAGKIMLLLGCAPSCSKEPGSDSLRDRIAVMLNKHREAAALAAHPAPSSDAAAWVALRDEIKSAMSTALTLPEMRKWKAHLATFDSAAHPANGAQAGDAELSDDDIKAVAINYAAHVAADIYDVTKYDCAEDFFNCVRACLAAAKKGGA